jgi:hypothetical protein
VLLLLVLAPHRYGHQPLLQQQRKAGWKPHSSSVGGSSSSSNNIGCDFCNMAVEYIKLALHNNQTLEQIEAVRVYLFLFIWVLRCLLARVHVGLSVCICLHLPV